jgi:hypothetical protein
MRTLLGAGLGVAVVATVLDAAAGFFSTGCSAHAANSMQPKIKTVLDKIAITKILFRLVWLDYTLLDLIMQCI